MTGHRQFSRTKRPGGVSLSVSSAFRRIPRLAFLFLIGILPEARTPMSISSVYGRAVGCVKSFFGRAGK
jgi:hypothetical protein